MLLQEGVPLKAACSWEKVARVLPPMAVSWSLPMVLDLVSLSLSRGGTDLSLLDGVNCRNKSTPAYFFSTIMLVEVCRGPIWWISWPFFPCFLHPCRNPTVLHGTAHPFSQLSIYHSPGCSNQLLVHWPSRPLHGQPDKGNPIPSHTPARKLLPAFLCKSWEVPEYWVHLRRVTGSCWDLSRFVPASAPPCARNSQVFNYNPLWEAAEDTGDFGGSCLETSAASSPCSA